MVSKLKRPTGEKLYFGQKTRPGPQSKEQGDKQNQFGDRLVETDRDDLYSSLPESEVWEAEYSSLLLLSTSKYNKSDLCPQVYISHSFLFM